MATTAKTEKEMKTAIENVDKKIEWKRKLNTE